MKFDTAAFVVFTVKASTPFVMLPSKEDTPTNNVNAIPSAHTTELLKNFERNYDRSIECFVKNRKK